QSPTGHALPPRLERRAIEFLLELSRKAVVRQRLKGTVLVRTGDMPDVGLAQSGSRSDQRVEHGLQIEGRAADDLEHVGGGGLLLQRLAKLAEQPRVLDGDDGLRGEALHQLNLLVRERAHLLTVDADYAD